MVVSNKERPLFFALDAIGSRFWVMVDSFLRGGAPRLVNHWGGAAQIVDETFLRGYQR